MKGGGSTRNKEGNRRFGKPPVDNRGKGGGGLQGTKSTRGKHTLPLAAKKKEETTTSPRTTQAREKKKKSKVGKGYKTILKSSRRKGGRRTASKKNLVSQKKAGTRKKGKEEEDDLYEMPRQRKKELAPALKKNVSEVGKKDQGRSTPNKKNRNRRGNLNSSIYRTFRRGGKGGA